MSGYTSREVAKLLDLPVGRVRAFVKSGLVAPARGTRGVLQFSFQDLVLLRAAKELARQRVSPRHLRAALKNLRGELPTGRPLSALSIAADAGRVVVYDGRRRWNPESGQMLFSFDVAELAAKVAPLAQRRIEAAREASVRLGPEEWYQLGCEAEAANPEQARDAYRRAIELEPDHADAHTNLGRLLHEAGEISAAEAHYRLALAAHADHLTALFNLGVALEDRGKNDQAMAAYRRVLTLDPDYADAHYNLARICERLGRRLAAVRHLKAYRNLVVR